MELKLERYSDNANSTLGLLFIDGKFECYTLEDEYRPIEKKVYSETRIPAGQYSITLATVGTLCERYKNSQYPAIKESYRGILLLKNVPSFTGICIHAGNTEKDTAGCILVGDSVNNNQTTPGFLGDSVSAYVRMYKKVVRAMGDQSVKISVIDNDRNLSNEE